MVKICIFVNSNAYMRMLIHRNHRTVAFVTIVRPPPLRRRHWYRNAIQGMLFPFCLHLRACELAGLRACGLPGLLACVRIRVRSFLRACLPACVRGARACMFMCVCGIFKSTSKFENVDLSLIPILVTKCAWYCHQLYLINKAVSIEIHTRYVLLTSSVLSKSHTPTNIVRWR